MTATLLTIGDEILLGQIVNTNAAWIGERLALAGVTLARMETVGDDEAAIAAALRRALAESDLVLTTGGLGPTHDDLTVGVAADVAGAPLALDEALLATIAARYAERGRSLPDAARRLALVPAGFDVLPNPKGMAPGLWGTLRADGLGGGRDRLIALLPGVPYEMKAIVDESVLPRVRERAGTAAVLHRTLLTAGEGETLLAERIGDLAPLTADGLALAFLPSTGTVRLRLTARGDNRAAVQAALDRGAALLHERLGDLVFGEGETTLEAVVLDLLAARGLTLAVAESCTGGALAARLTAVPGASRAFRGGVVAYANDVKRSLLGVPAADLDAHGAVSEPVARAMAEGVRRATGADLTVATTGIAGPTGGSAEKPVGTVWLGFAGPAGTHAVRLAFARDRAVNIALSTTAALNLVRRQVLRMDAARGPLTARG